MRASIRMAVAAAMFVIAGMGTQGGALGADDSRIWVASVVSVEGAVEVKRQGEVVWKAIAMDERVFEGDTLRVQRRSRAALQFRNGATMRLDQETTVTLGEATPRRSFWVQILTGASYFFSHAPRSLEIRTPFVNGSIEGTEFAVTVGQSEAKVAVLGGRVALSNQNGRLSLGRGQNGVAAAGQAPVLRPQVSSRDMVRWTVFFPPVATYGAEDFKDCPPEWRDAVLSVVAKRQAGDVMGALAALPEKMDSVSDPRVLLLRAELLMAVGRQAEADADVNRAVALKPGCVDALALQAMAALLAGRHEDAMGIAGKAVESDARSVPARVALSYAYQAVANLDAALREAREAQSAGQGNSMVQARVAELLLMQGERRAAVEEARRVVARDPGWALAHVVLGFAHLARADRSAAAAAFRRAIALSPGDPQPRLGLGLAKIRGGDLAGGRAELEIAVALDPSQSLLRSYLGKAYAEERRDGLSERELDRARELDPNDPTPYLYDAMRKQTLNRPGEALTDIQESVERNDARAVYRSRLLLDSDSAVRGVSQARIYEDLGFSQLAFSEACRSVTLDPGNASAHRFLADAYAGMPRSEIARESELLVAQLRQPQGAGLIQPRLGEARPGVLTDIGAVDPAYNEYTRLFERDGWRGIASVFAGNQESWGQEVIAGGVFDRYAFSAGESRIMSDGWRENADIDENVQNVIGSIAVTPEFTLLAGYRRQEVEEGDTDLRFDPENYSATLRQRTTRETIQFGGRFALGPGADLIVAGHRQKLTTSSSDTTAVMVQSQEEADSMVPLNASIEADGDNTAWDGEIQFSRQWRTMSVLFGCGAYSDRGVTSIGVTQGEEATPLTATDADARARHDNAYLYASWRPPGPLDIILGASVDRFDSPDSEGSQFNPKAGVLWMPSAGTMIRAAGFRTMKRSLVAQQTVEPASVAGFQQFRDDQNATDAWKYGLGIDQRLGPSWFLGAAIERETADMPYFFDDEEGSRRMTVERRNWLLRSYCYGLVVPPLAVGLEFYTFKQDSDNGTAPFAQEVDTYWMPVSLRYHLSNGLFFRVRTTLVRQSGQFLETGTGGIEADADTFLTSDADIGYRLPGRRGVLSIEGRNVFDRRFRYQSAEVDLPLREPARLVLVKLTAVF